MAVYRGTFCSVVRLDRHSVAYLVQVGLPDVCAAFVVRLSRPRLSTSAMAVYRSAFFCSVVRLGRHKVVCLAQVGLPDMHATFVIRLSCPRLGALAP